jgi:hypothetical protein
MQHHRERKDRALSQEAISKGRGEGKWRAFEALHKEINNREVSGGRGMSA